MKEMERTEFTPGPWQVREGSYCEVEDAQGKRIARTVLQRQQNASGEHAADRRSAGDVRASGYDTDISGSFGR